MIALSRGEVAAYYKTRAPHLRQHGKRWRGPCPIHRGKQNSLSVEAETGLWRCWSDCGRGGDIITLEMALTGLAWRDAVMEIERIVGRVLLDRPSSGSERRALAERLELDARETRQAELLKLGATAWAEDQLAQLPTETPERFELTQLLLKLKEGRSADLLALYRDWRSRDAQLTEAWIHAGEQAWERLAERVAMFLAKEVEHAA